MLPAAPEAEPRTGLGRGWNAVDRNVRPGLGGELSPCPVAVPGLQLEPGQLGHEVELSRPDVAVRAAEELRLLALTESEVVRDNVLVQTS